MNIVFLLIIIFTALLLWFIAGAKGYLILKIVAVPVSLYAVLAIYYSLTNVLGWAALPPLPDKFELIYAEVQEPIPAFEDPGKIVLLVKNYSNIHHDWFSIYSPPDKESRLYVIPYTKGDGDSVQKAMQMLRDGKRVMGGRGSGQEGDGEGKRDGENGDGSGRGKNGGGKGTGGGDIESDMKFYVLPPAKRPPKLK